MASSQPCIAQSAIARALESVERPQAIAKQGRDLALVLAEEVAEEILDGDEESRDILASMRAQTLEWVQFEHTCANLASVVTRARDAAQKGDLNLDTDLEREWWPKFEAAMVAEKDERQLKKRDGFKEFEEKIQEILGNDVGAKRDEDDDDDMLVTQEETNLNCPITRKLFVNPMRNKKCKHVYDEEGVDMLCRQRGTFKCPVPSCPNREEVRKTDLEPDRRMIRLVKAKKDKR